MGVNPRPHVDAFVIGLLIVNTNNKRGTIRWLLFVCHPSSDISYKSVKCTLRISVVGAGREALIGQKGAGSGLIWLSVN